MFDADMTSLDQQIEILPRIKRSTLYTIQLHQCGPPTPPAAVHGRVAAHLRRFQSEKSVGRPSAGQFALSATRYGLYLAKSRDVHHLRV